MSRARGFTLIELLVAMTVLGLISVALLGSLRFGATAWTRSDTAGRSVETIELAESVLRRALASAYPSLVALDQTHPHIEFSGSSDRIEFLAPAPEALGGAGLARITVAVARGAEGTRLTIAAMPELAAESGTPAAPSVLADGFAAAEFAYFGAETPDAEPAWHGTWQDRMDLPQLIEVTVSFPSGDPRRWPALLVKPEIAVDEGCVFEPTTKRCRGR
jgi:general secretion pathway protein J